METMKQIKPTTEALHELAKTNHTAENVLFALALRERNSGETDLNAFRYALIRSGLKIIDEEFNQLFVKLQEMGAGSVIHGRKGKSDRFKWHYSLIDIGNMAFDKSVVDARKAVIDQEKEVKAAETPKKRARKSKFNRSKFMKQFWASRRGKQVKRGRPAGSKNKVNKNDNAQVIKLLSQVLKELKKSA